jgi:hypothetical protein
MASVQLALLVEMFRLYPDQFRFVRYDLFEERREGAHWPTDHRLEDVQWANRLSSGEGVETILAEWEAQSREFVRVREPYLLY